LFIGLAFQQTFGKHPQLPFWIAAAQIDSTVMNASLSSLATALHWTPRTIHWLTSEYLLVLSVLMPMNGWLVDLVSTRTLFHLRGAICIS
jgi:MFS family permease